MKIALAILSDIHFELGKGHPILARTDQLASAIVSADPEIRSLFLVLAGDVANGGLEAEFEMAANFLGQLKAKVSQRIPHVDIKTISTPGNHDCYLPQDAVAHRQSRIEGSLKVVTGHDPDELFLKDLLSVQDNYWDFASKNTDLHQISISSKVCSLAVFQVEDKLIQINLINSALLSQRHESKAGLHLPMEMIKHALSLSSDKCLSVSLMHHPEFWIEPSTMVSLRRTLARVSDLVITGHEHVNNSFSKLQSDGENLSFYESPALFDQAYPLSSAFRTLVFDLENSRQKEVNFRWKDGLYRGISHSEVDWKPLILNRVSRHSFELSPEHLRNLSDVGVAYIHPNASQIALRDLFVYPDIRTEVVGESDFKTVRGSTVLNVLSKCGTILLEGGAFSGKTALSKQLCYDLLSRLDKVPILLKGRDLDGLTVEHLQRHITREFKHQYRDPDVDAYLQASRDQRVIIVDDWHLARLSDARRREIYEFFGTFASAAILLVDDLFKLKQLVSTDGTIGSQASKGLVTTGEIVGLSYVSRGKLIHNWYELRKDADHDPPQINNAVKASEDFISTLLGKDNLPPYAFFVLCMMQAQESNKVDTVAGGSFGHYHQVLVTTTLTKGRSQEAQLDRKVAFCSELAYYLWKHKADVVSRTEIDDIVQRYLDKHLLTLQTDKLLLDLEDARVLSRSEDHYRFTYPQFFFYFVARYIKENFDSEESDSLREAVNTMVDQISSNQNSSVIMFLIFFANDRRHIIERLLLNASQIYGDVQPANLKEDVIPFLAYNDYLLPPPIEENPDVAANRMKERERRDAEEDKDVSVATNTFEAYSYAANLDDTRKMHLAERNIEALGQVIRNFSTTLPANLKVDVLQATYNLGLRTMASVLTQVANLLKEKTQEIASSVDKDYSWELADGSLSITEVRQEISKFLFVMGKLVSIHYCKKISSSVGVYDNEHAYRRAMESMSPTTAIKLIDITIQMEHSAGFPEARVKALFEELHSNAFATGILQFLVALHLMLYKVDPATRKRVSRLAGVDHRKLDAASLELQKEL